MSHTPGPWQLMVSRTRVHLHGAAGYFGISLPWTRKQDKANARLIAAAPEFLQWAKDAFANQNCVCKLNPLVGGPVPCQTCQLGSLIAKAEGGPR